MFKALFKKQMTETWAFLVHNVKTGKRRTKANQIGYAFLMLLVTVMMFFIFATVTILMCEPLVSVGLDWFFMFIMCILAIFMGVFGSVFNTYSTVYLAKDNEQLLSMPIPSWMILVVRIAGVYVMGLYYELMVMVPTIFVYAVEGNAGVGKIVTSILLAFAISILTMILSCALGGVVAWISVHLKNKSFVTVLISLVGIAIYYYVCGNAMAFIEDIAVFGQENAEKIKNSAAYFYYMGKAGTGDVKSLLLFSGITLVIFAICFVVLSKSFLFIITTNKGDTKKKEKAVKVTETKVRPITVALLHKEFLRFTGSATYMLNCALGVIAYILIFGMAVLMILEVNVMSLPEIKELMLMAFGQDRAFFALILCLVLCASGSMVDITAPSISLEGKNLWLVQTTPISAWNVLLAKLSLHVLVVGIPALLASVAMMIAFEMYTSAMFFVPAITILYNVLIALIGLILDLKRPNFAWSNEGAPIKQSASVTITLFGAMGIVALGCVAYYFLRDTISAQIFMVLLFAVLTVLVGAGMLWLKKKGTENFEAL